MDPFSGAMAETASFCWVLIGNQNVLACGDGPVDGIILVLSSTRANLFGIAAPNELLYHNLSQN